MPIFRISRTKKVYEHCDIIARDFKQALKESLEVDFLESESYDWKDSELGNDYYVTAIAKLNKDGTGTEEDRDVDENGEFVD